MTKNLLQDKDKKFSFSLKSAASSVGHAGQRSDDMQIEYTDCSSGSADGNKNYIHFAFICNRELARKVRAIARKENIPIRKIIEKAMTDWISKYEQKNGPIGEVKTRSVDDLC